MCSKNVSSLIFHWSVNQTVPTQSYPIGWVNLKMSYLPHSIASSTKHPHFSFKLNVMNESSLILLTDLPRLPFQTDYNGPVCFSSLNAVDLNITTAQSTDIKYSIQCFSWEEEEEIQKIQRSFKVWECITHTHAQAGLSASHTWLCFTFYPPLTSANKSLLQSRRTWESEGGGEKIIIKKQARRLPLSLPEGADRKKRETKKKKTNSHYSHGENETVSVSQQHHINYP